MNKTVPLVLSALLIVASCAIQDPEIPYLGQSKSMLFTAYCAGPETKSSILADNSVMWSPNEQIVIFNSTSLPGAVFTSTNKQPAARAEFLGEMVTSAPGVMDCVYAFYPASAAISFDGSSITAELPHLQEAVGGSFADNTNLTLAKSTDTDLSFYNICSGFRFSVTHKGIKSVTFRGNNNEDIAGKFSVGMGEDGKPAQPVILEGQKVVTLSAPEGETLEVGPLYYIEILPQTFSKGFTVTFETANESGSRSITSSASFARSSFNRGIDFDKSIDYSVKNIDAPIVFADEHVKAMLVDAFDHTINTPFDANFDGEISFAEAAVVTYLPDFSYFRAKDNMSIVSFDEFQYFESVTSIGNWIFSDCAELTSITIPESVTSIGKYAFSGCSGLTSINMPDGITSIGDGAFYDCSGLTSINIPDGIASIGDGAFSGCSGLTSINIPDGITSIGDGAFSECSGLTSITIPESVTSIGNNAFSGCSGLTSLSIPLNVTSVGYCYLQIAEGILVTASPNYELSIDSPRINWVIPDGVTSIKNYAFHGCSGLASITIPESVTSIGDNAFYSCSGLTSITIPEKVTSIGNNAFSGCSGLTSINIPDGITSIGDGAFSGCSGLTSITIPEKVTSIGNNAFQDCSGLTSITIPEKVTSIGNSAFFDCSGLTAITIPESVTSIGDNAFYSCSGLTSITIPQSVISIGMSTFSNCIGLTSITIPENVTSIGIQAFYGCDSLSSIVLQSITPPSIVPQELSSSYPVFYGSYPIFVPSASIELYKTTTVWSNYADRIQTIPEQ